MHDVDPSFFVNHSWDDPGLGQKHSILDPCLTVLDYTVTYLPTIYQAILLSLTDES